MMLREKIKEALKDAMRARESCRVATMRLILAAVKDRDIALRVEDVTELDDDTLILEILSKMVKQRHDSIKAYEEGGRLELAEQERLEIEIIGEFLPEQMSEQEIDAAARAAVQETGAESLKDMGGVMAVLKAKYAGTMDFGKASQVVKSLLS
ncbi:MAG: GatB/YqeY domain-containing protein [Proteobacteria bacterium]|nr:GatB/YqeY domain-containing protein [Pseudomonadota bacterium]